MLRGTSLNDTSVGKNDSSAFDEVQSQTLLMAVHTITAASKMARDSNAMHVY